MIDYIFYKLFRASQRSSIPEIAGLLAGIVFSLCLAINTLTVMGFLKKMHYVDFFPSEHQFYYIVAGIFLLVCLRYFSRSQYKKILEKHQQESITSKYHGRVYVTLYIVFTYVLFFVSAFFRQGEL